MKTLVFDLHDQWMLLVHGQSPPSKEEWEVYVGALREAEKTAKGLLVLTDGEGPDSLQRKMVSDVQLRTAVTTPSRLARGIVTALGWLGADIKAFAPNQVDDALAYLEVPERARTSFAHKLLQLRMEVVGDQTIPSDTPYPKLLNMLELSLDELKPTE